MGVDVWWEKEKKRKEKLLFSATTILWKKNNYVFVKRFKRLKIDFWKKVTVELV